MKIHRLHVIGLAIEVVDSIGTPFRKTTELQRQVMATFSYGYIHTYCQEQDLNLEDTQALLIAILIEVFKYSAEQAGTFSHEVINAMLEGDPNNTHKAIVHRGLEGYVDKIESEKRTLKENLEEIFLILGN